MRLRKKFIIIIALVGIATVIALLVSSQLILLPSFAKLEEAKVQENIERTLSVLSNEFSELSSKTGDYAEWDDTYVFVQDGNEEYIQANLDPGTFANLRVDIVLFINIQGQLVFGRAFQHDTLEVTTVPQTLLGLLSADDHLWKHSTVDSVTTGLVPINQPLLIASRPVLTNEHEGPIAGTLIMGRYLNTEEVDYLAETVHLPISVDRFDTSQVPLSKEKTIYMQPLTADSIAGYALIDDIYGNPLLVLSLEMPRDIYKQGQTNVTYFLFSLLATGVVFGVTVLLIVEKQVLRRVDRLATDVRNIGKSTSFSERLSWNKTDELSILAGAIDHMMEDRLNAIGQLAAMVGHDMRNPLTGISNAAFYLKMKINTETDPKAKEMLDIIEKDVEYSNKIVNDLLDYSRKIKLELTQSNPKTIVKDALALVNIPLNVQVQDLADDKPTIKVDVDKMKRVFVNLLKNAVEALPEGGQLTIRSKEVKGKVEISVADTGEGIPKETLDKLFIPLFTTKSKGMGLGLAICKRIVEAHGGDISVESAIGKGTTFTITLLREPVLDGGEKL